MKRAREIVYVTGTRADFGLMLPVLQAIDKSDGFKLRLVVAGMHFSERFGHTLTEVEASGLTIADRIRLPVEDDSADGMAACAGDMAAAMAKYFARSRPDALLLLGDRSEMLASALPAVLASIPIVHLCGGERSGTVDESLRHAISKLAHVHFVANRDAAQRLSGMGEEPWRIHEVGAPGLVGLADLARMSRAAVLTRYGLDPARPYALVLFHPVVQDAEAAGQPVRLTLDLLAETDLQALCLMPNADHGSGKIRAELSKSRSFCTVVTHMPRHDFVSAMAHAEVMIGNSSSGIVEAATFGTPVLNVGDRQKGRARNPNTFDVELAPKRMREALQEALRWNRADRSNVYGGGEADRLVVQALNAIDWDEPKLLKKQMTY